MHLESARYSNGGSCFHSIHGGSVKFWVEFLSSKQQLSSVGDKSEPITCIALRIGEEDKAEDVRQLVNLLVRAISTHCAAFERLPHFKLEYKGRAVHSEITSRRYYRYYNTWAYMASDAIPHHLDAMTREVCHFLGNLPLAITKFTFSATLFHPKLGNRMLASLSENRHLTELNIENFNFATIAPTIFLDWVSNFDAETLRDSKEGCSFFIRAFFNGKTSMLRRLTFSNAYVTELDADAIELLKCNTHLQHLDLNNNPIGDAGASLIAEVLKVNKALKFLDMTSCSIGDQGCTALAQALEVNTTLETLHLDSNKFGDAGASPIAEVLKVNKTLKNLGIGGCDISDQGFTALAQVLEVNTTLETLHLDFNKFGDAGVRALVLALRVNRSLRILGLWDGRGPSCSKETEEQLLQVVRHFLLPLVLRLRSETDTIVLNKACDFNRDFDENCQKLRDGTTNASDKKSCHWFLPLLGSTHPFVKSTVLFLLLRQRAEVASQSFVLLQNKSQKQEERCIVL